MANSSNLTCAITQVTWSELGMRDLESLYEVLSLNFNVIDGKKKKKVSPYGV